jgi:hypothetical protein
MNKHECNHRIVLGAMGLQYSSTVEARYVALLRLLRLGRAYRLKKVRGQPALCIGIGARWHTSARVCEGAWVAIGGLRC